jgi:hypothetical protein
MKPAKWMQVIPWLLGFLLVANLYVLPDSSSSPRATDLLSLFLWGWLLWRLLGRGLTASPLLAVLTLNVIPLAWGVYAYFQGWQSTMLLSMRWLLAVPWGYVLFLWAQNRTGRTSLIWGLWWGLVLNVAVLALQYAGFEEWTMRLGLAARDSDIISIERFLMRSPGMHGHANASAAVASLIVPVGLYLYFRIGAKVWVPLASLLLLLVAGHITSSRSPLFVSGACYVVVALTSRRFIRSLALLGLMALILYPLWLHFGPPGGKIRWSDTAHMAANTSERLASNVTAIRLTGEHLLGMGIEESREAISEELNNPATHNAFLQVGVVYGPLQAAWLLLLMGLLAWHTLQGIQRPWGLEALLALQICGLFFFEEHLNDPTFIILVAWLGVASWTRLTSSSLQPDESLRRRRPVIRRESSE